MRFKFTISHSILGSLEINEPDGWKDAVIKLERHDEFHSLIEYFDGSFILYGNNGIVNGGIDFVKEVEQSFGLDETIVVDIDVTFDEITFSNVFNGQYKIADLEEMPNNKMRIPIIRDDFWAKFIARLDTPVDLKSPVDLDGNETALSQEVNLKLEPQIIDATHYSIEDRGRYIQSDNDYIQYQPNKVELDEIKQYFTLPYASNPEKPVWIIGFEFGGALDVDIRIEYDKAIFVPNDGHTSPRTIYDFYIQKNEDAPIEFNYVIQTYHDASVYDSWGVFDPGTDLVTTAVATFLGTFQIAKGDILRIYLNRDSVATNNIAFWGTDGLHVDPTGSDSSVFGANRPIGMVEIPTYFRFVQHTRFPQTNNSGFLLHDVGAAITDRTTAQVGSFYSELLGSPLTTARQYEDEGCGWNYGLVKGLQLRQYTLSEKPFFQSFNQWWKGINPILNLSLGYDEIDGDQVIRVEDKGFQYEIGDTSIDFSNVEGITRKYDPDNIFNKVEIGYARWQSEDVSGIDDPQTKKTYSDRLQKSGKTLTLYSEFIAASLAIETTRRQTRLKSADYKFDNETFIIALNPDLQEESPDVSPDLLQFIPELDENFSVVTNLLNAETRYNLKITPAHNFLRWQNYAQIGLQSYLGTEFKFASGEGNYDMTSTMDTSGCLNEDFEGNNLDEKGSIPVTSDVLHLPHLYECSIPMDWTDYETIRNNKRKPIGISQTSSDHVPMYIKTLSYKPVKGTCDLLLRAKEYLELSIVADTTPMQECQPTSEDCETALTDGDGNNLTDELGICIYA